MLCVLLLWFSSIVVNDETVGFLKPGVHVFIYLFVQFDDPVICSVSIVH